MPTGKGIAQDGSQQPVSDSIELQPFYHDAKDGIIRPKQVVVSTRYFWERWAPRLGPTLSVLIVRLRMHCYYNQVTKERRDWCFPTQQTLAEEVGVSRWTIMRELKRPEARHFVRVQCRSRFDPERKRTIRISSLYHVAMDDPLVAEDVDRASTIAAGYLLESEDVAAVPAARKTTPTLLAALPAHAGHRVHLATGPNAGNLPTEEIPEDSTDSVDVVARELVQANITETAARRLATDFPAELIRQKMSLVRDLKSRQSLRNEAGFLRKAIEDDYSVPLQATGTDAIAASMPLVRMRGWGGQEPGVAERSPSAAASVQAVVRDAHDVAPARDLRLLAPTTSSSGPASERTGDVNVWEVAKQALSGEMKPAAFAQWLAPSKLLRYEPGLASVTVPCVRSLRYLEQRLKWQIEDALSAICGCPTRLKLIVEGESH